MAMMFTSFELNDLAEKLRGCEFLGQRLYNMCSIIADELETVALGVDGMLFNKTDVEALRDLFPDD